MELTCWWNQLWIIFMNMKSITAARHSTNSNFITNHSLRMNDLMKLSCWRRMRPREGESIKQFQFISQFTPQISWSEWKWMDCLLNEQAGPQTTLSISFHCVGWNEMECCWLLRTIFYPFTIPSIITFDGVESKVKWLIGVAHSIIIWTYY